MAVLGEFVKGLSQHDKAMEHATQRAEERECLRAAA